MGLQRFGLPINCAFSRSGAGNDEQMFSFKGDGVPPNNGGTHGIGDFNKFFVRECFGIGFVVSWM
jgi:hypothetical protein